MQTQLQQKVRGLWNKAQAEKTIVNWWQGNKSSYFHRQGVYQVIISIFPEFHFLKNFSSVYMAKYTIINQKIPVYNKKIKFYHTHTYISNKYRPSYPFPFINKIY